MDLEQENGSWNLYHSSVPGTFITLEPLSLWNLYHS